MCICQFCTRTFCTAPLSFLQSKNFERVVTLAQAIFFTAPRIQFDPKHNSNPDTK